jgi:predicted nucleic acid-binding protein
MSKLELSQLRQGSRIAYDDGRGEAQATVLAVEHWCMHVQFDDRAAPSCIPFNRKEWMDYLHVVEV